MKIVLDTNVLVSGILQPFGPPGQIVRLVASGELVLCYDSRMLAEYEEVLRRPKFCFEPARIDTLLGQIRAEGIPVAARPLSIRLPDLEDEPFLEVAVSSPALCLVTGNAKHYPGRARQNVRVVSPREFVELHRAEQFE